MGEQQNDWYDNKELFEKIQDLKKELQETREIISKYNGLRKQIGELQKTAKDLRKQNEKLEIEINHIKSQSAGRVQVFEGIRKWIPWIIAIVSAIFAIKGG